MLDKWILPMPTDYFDNRIMNCAYEYSQEIWISRDREYIYSLINNHIFELMDLLYSDTEKFQLTVCCVIDDLYHSVFTTNQINPAYIEYLNRVAKPFFDYLKQMGLKVHYSTDNTFENHYLPVEILPAFWEACGVKYVCPYKIAKQEMLKNGEGLENYPRLIRSYLPVAELEAEKQIRTLSKKNEHYFYLFSGGRKENFNEVLKYTGKNGVLTLFRDAFPPQSSEISFLSCKNFS